MADVFVSYSRRDSGFVRRLADSVSKQGKEVWLDTEGIADGEVFPEAIKRAIEQSDGFVFVITPSSVDSPYCENEVDYACELQKRIVPVLRTPVPDSELPPEIRDRNWIPFTDETEFEPSIGRLLSALDTDLDAARAHTRWLVKALEWDAEGRDKSFLLRGSELKGAEAWLASRPEDADPAPTQLQREYLLASRTAAARRQRSLVAASGIVALVSVGLLIFALISRGQAVSERVSARAQALAAESQAQLPNDPEISLILGARAVRQRASPQALFALRAAIDGAPLELGLPTVSVPSSCANGNGSLGFTAAYSPDGRQIAQAICSGDLRLLDARTGRLLHSGRVGRGASGLAYSPDGAALAVAAGPGVVLVNPRTGAIVRRLGGVVMAQTLDVAFRPDGRVLAATTPAGLIVWSLPQGRARMVARAPAVGFSLAFSPDGRRLYTGGFDGLVRVYDAGTGRQLRQLDPFPAANGQSGWPLVVAVSHDGRRLAVAYPSGAQVGVVSLYSTRTWRRQFDVMSIPDVALQSLAFSPDDTRLAVGAADGTAGVWSLTAREQLVAYDGPTAGVNSLSFSPDGTRVVTASSDGITRVWRAAGAEQAFVPFRSHIDGMALRRDSLEVLQNSAQGGWWVSWSRLPGGQTTRTVTLLPAENNSFASLSADGRFAFVARFRAPSTGGSPTREEMTIVDTATGRVVRRLGLATPEPVGQFTFSADDTRLILEELASPRIIPGPGGVGRGLTGVDHLVLLTLASGRAMTLPDAGPCGPGTGVKWAFSGDGRRVAQEAFCGIVDVWDTRTGRLLRQIDQGAETSAVALDHDGSRLLVSSWDSRATIWSVATGRRLVNLVGHTRGIADAALSPDGTRVVTGSLDRTLRVWDARTGQTLRVLTFPDFPAPVTLSGDGSEVALVDTTPIYGVPSIVRVFDTCPACQDAAALLRLAQPHTTTQLTQLERTVVAGA